MSGCHNLRRLGRERGVTRLRQARNHRGSTHVGIALRHQQARAEGDVHRLVEGRFEDQPARGE
eukprot:14888748-Alexandrium_andersonii.AAC.1